MVLNIMHFKVLCKGPEFPVRPYGQSCLFWNHPLFNKNFGIYSMYWYKGANKPPQWAQLLFHFITTKKQFSTQKSWISISQWLQIMKVKLCYNQGIIANKGKPEKSNRMSINKIWQLQYILLGNVCKNVSCSVTI